MMTKMTNKQNQQRKADEKQVLYRAVDFKREHIDEEARTVEVAFSSETETVERWFGVEVLDHGAGSVRLGRLQNGAPLLVDHDTRDHIGVVVSVSIDSDRVGRATVRFGKSARANEIFSDVVDGIRTKISVGYRTFKREETDEGTENKPVYRVTDWEPMEISIVSVAADDDVGVGRGAEQIKSNDNKEETQMSKENTPAAPAAAPAPAAERTPDFDVNQAREEIRKAELKRISEINSIGGRRDAKDLAKEFIDSGRSVDEFRTAVLDRMDQAVDADTASPARHANVDMDDRHHQEYSVVRAMNAAVHNDWSNAGFEREISQEVGRQLGRKTEGLFIPTNLRNTPEMAARALNVGTTTAGGHTVQTDVGTLIDLLRNRMMVNRMGATVLSSLEGDMKFPRQSAASTFSWVAENPGSDLADSDATFDQVTLSPKNGQSTTAYSKQLLAQSSLDVEMLVRNDLTRIAAIGIDLAALHGTGASNQPTGIINVAGIGDVVGDTNGLAPTWAHIVELESDVANANADLGALGYLTNAKVRGKLKTTEKASGTAQFVWGDGSEPGFGMLNGYRAGVSNQVASNLDKGTSTGVCSAIFFGNWADLLIGEWGAIEILLDPYAKKKQGLVEITSFVMADIQVRHAQSFSVMKDALTA